MLPPPLRVAVCVLAYALLDGTECCHVLLFGLSVRLVCQGLLGS
jgi:hypothetical protein